MALSIHGLIDDAKCYAMVRDLRWPEGVACPHCQSKQVAKNGVTLQPSEVFLDGNGGNCLVVMNCSSAATTVRMGAWPRCLSVRKTLIRTAWPSAP